MLVGLGNPGKQYELTRHNIGFLAVKYIASQLGLTFKRNDNIECEYCSTIIKPDKTILKQMQDKAKLREQSRIFHEMKQRNDPNTPKSAGLVPISDEFIIQQAKQLIERQFIFDQVELHLILPQAFMNLSGTPVYNYISSHLRQDYSIKMLKQTAQSNKKAPFRMLIIYDDVSIPFGQMRLKYKGGDGGHNGIASIERRFGTADRLHRLRLGIAPNPNIEGMRQLGINNTVPNLSDYVLQRFSHSAEQSRFPLLFSNVHRVVMDYALKDLNIVMNEANNIDISQQPLKQ